MRIAFICTANVARSIMAESIFRSILDKLGWTDIEVFSAGVKDYTDVEPIDKVVTVCAKHGTPVCKSGATFMDDIDMESMDWILAMQFAHIAKLRKEKNLPTKVKVALLGEYSPLADDVHEIIDPMGKRMSVFEKCYKKIDQCVQMFIRTELLDKTNQAQDEGDTLLTFREWAEKDDQEGESFRVIQDNGSSNSPGELTFRELDEDPQAAGN